MLLRAVKYVGRHRRLAVLAYGSLLVATAAQLMVPQLVRIIIDSFVSGAQGTTGQSAAVQTLIAAMVAIVVFSVVRALFAFGQQYNAERISQNVAFDIRNQLFAKIQRLSFSYHDRNQTGQLMIRATDDVEKVRLFIGQGLAISLQAVVLLVGPLVILGLTNHLLPLAILPILPVAFIAFMIFGALA